jgi:Na+:H+ antiporter, NhaA family
MDQNVTPTSEQTFVRRLLLSIERFLRVETAGGVVLLVATAAALTWANSPWHSGYEALWEAKVVPDFAGLRALTDFVAPRPLRFWINDGLMTLFFLVVGLEVRHELRHGSLSDPRIATLPIVSAIAGVLVPALIYLLVNTDAVSRRGWAVPTATDIAFAVGILSLVGKGIPPALRMLLLTLAIIDDVVAILIIALAYSSGIQLAALALAACGAFIVWAMRCLGIRPLAYILPGGLIWFEMLRSGIHPTLAGVVLGMMAPATAASNHLLRRLHPWVAYAIMPLFAFANAGVSLKHLPLSAGAALTVTSGIVLGLALGKPLGIVLAAAAAVRSGICTLPEGVGWRHLVLLGCLGGIGFTMSIFIANLAFPDPALLATAKTAVLLASTVAAITGLVLGRCLPGMRQQA